MALLGPVAAMVVGHLGDVPPDHPHAEAIGWATGSGVMPVGPDGFFRPDDPVTRAELAEALYRMERGNWRITANDNTRREYRLDGEAYLYEGADRTWPISEGGYGVPVPISVQLSLECAKYQDLGWVAAVRFYPSDLPGDKTTVEVSRTSVVRRPGDDLRLMERLADDPYHLMTYRGYYTESGVTSFVATFDTRGIERVLASFPCYDQDPWRPLPICPGVEADTRRAYDVMMSRWYPNDPRADLRVQALDPTVFDSQYGGGGDTSDGLAIPPDLIVYKGFPTVDPSTGQPCAGVLWGPWIIPHEVVHLRPSWDRCSATHPEYETNGRDDDHCEGFHERVRQLTEALAS